VTYNFSGVAPVARISGIVSGGSHAGKEFRFFVADERDLIQAHHLRGEFYEPEELAIISEFFSRGGVFVDIGANVGNHTVYVCKFLHPMQVIVFEPNPPAASVLELNVALNGLQRLVDLSHLGVGLSDSNGRAHPEVHAGNLGATCMIPTDDPNGLPLIRGDAVLSQRRVDFIKIDVEGMEMRALAGLGETIARWRPAMFIEVDNANSDAFQAWVEDNDYVSARTFRRYPTNENHMIVPVEAAERERGLPD
jgi:FkbM family methyltransferase